MSEIPTPLTENSNLQMDDEFLARIVCASLLGVGLSQISEGQVDILGFNVFDVNTALITEDVEGNPTIDNPVLTMDPSTHQITIEGKNSHALLFSLTPIVQEDDPHTPLDTTSDNHQ